MRHSEVNSIRTNNDNTDTLPAKQLHRHVSRHFSSHLLQTIIRVTIRSIASQTHILNSTISSLL
jgi:hypothetical protein